MNRQIKTFSTIILFSVLIISSVTTAQETAKPDSSHSGMKKMNCSKDSLNTENTMKCKKNTEKTTASEVDVDGIDKNKDGKVFQCPMDYDVISDSPGVDPRCGMKLEEVSVKKAKENLLRNNFKVK